MFLILFFRCLGREQGGCIRAGGRGGRFLKERVIRGRGGAGGHKGRVGAAKYFFRGLKFPPSR